MILQSSSASFSFSQKVIGIPELCPCRSFTFSRKRRKKLLFSKRFSFLACVIPNDGRSNNLSVEFASSSRRGARNYVAKQISSELEAEEESSSSSPPIQMGPNFTNFQEDPLVDKLRTQLGVIHPIPSPPINRNIVGLFVFFFFVGVVFDKLWTSRKNNKMRNEDKLRGAWPQVPTSFSLFLEKDLQRKESVEWVNMVLGKLWKVYRGEIENWIIGLLQPVIDNLKKPDYVQRVEIKQFSLGDEPLSVRNVERRTSRRVNDLQYQIGLRYTGGARMLLMLSLKFGIIPIAVPVGVRDFDIDGELWVKLRLIPTAPWVGAVSWAFVSLPKIKFELSPFRLFNLMAIPVLSMFLKKLLTEDLPRLFVRPKKIVLDFQKGKAVGPVATDLKSGEQEGNKDFVGELSVTLVDARKLFYVYGKTDPYVVLSLGDQIIRSKKNSQTTVFGPPGEPIWNQDFHLLVANPRKQKLYIQVKDSLGFADIPIGTGEVDLGSLQDTVPTDRIVVLRGGWGLFRNGFTGELLLRLTYKAYVEDEEDDTTLAEPLDTDVSDDEFTDYDETDASYELGETDSSNETDKDFMDVLAALIMSEEFHRRNGWTSQNGRSLVIVCGSGMNIAFVGTEVGPWSKTGGLGDVLGGLPSALAANGHRVMTIAPRYDQYKDAWDTEVVIELKVGDKMEKVGFFHCYKRGVDRVFVDHPLFLEKVWGKTKSKIYGPMAGEDYQDNQLRFSLLCQAALEAPRVLNLNSSKYFSGPYGEDVVFVANDWHTALIPCYMKTMYKPKGMYKSAKVVFCIHNIAYQGRFSFADFGLLNLPDQFKSSFDFIDGYGKPVKGRKINWMKAGVLESDKVLTVSPYYAQELVSGEDKGVELDNILRKTGIKGIVNGMDVQEWNPLTDKYIGVKYDASTVMDAKPLLKEALQAEVGLPIDRNIPVIGFIGRLEEQKGSDILVAAIPQFIKENVQIIVLGTGKKPMEKQLGQLEILYPEKARGVAKFNVPLAHMIIAGADFILIPSRFEPCGLIQLHAMRYGTVPIVASTGGLVDTVKEGFTGFQMGGFSVECEVVDPADVTAVSTTVTRAMGTYGTPALAEMIQNCMAQDLSWKGPAKKWEEVLLNLEVAGSEPGIDGEEISPLAKENVATP